MRTGVPSLASSNASITISHREFIGDVNGSVAFAVNNFALNPGVSATFPWLSGIAPRYESYVFRKLRFEYQNTCSTLTGGSVLLTADYDAKDAAPADKVTLMSYAGSTRNAPWQPGMHSSTSTNLTKFAKERYVRAGDPPADTDIRAYDVGNFFIATTGMADTAAVGELYVSYIIELRTPQL